MRIQSVLAAGVALVSLGLFSTVADATTGVGAYLGSPQNNAYLGYYGETWGGVSCTDSGGCGGTLWEVILPVSGSTATYSPKIAYGNWNAGDISCAFDVISFGGSAVDGTGLVGTSGSYGGTLQPAGSGYSVTPGSDYMFVACSLPHQADAIWGISY